MQAVTVNRPELEVITGKKVIEVRSGGTNKGDIVQRLLREHSPDFVFCAGDDRTDEDMFRVLHDFKLNSTTANNNNSQGIETEQLKENEQSLSVHTCLIGPSTKRSAAKERLDTPKQLLSLLNGLPA